MERTKRKAVLSFLRDYFLPPTCPGCGELTPMACPDAPFCPECRENWEREKLAPCSRCGLAMPDCRCLPKLLTENGVRDGLCLTAYHTGGGTVPDRTVYYIKENRDGRAFEFLARELSVPFRRLVREEELPGGRILIASMPRRKSAVREYGFDQAEELARALARETGYPYEKCLGRARAGREQKRLSAEERVKNTEGGFALKKGTDVSGRYVFLVDDVMTTGSSLYGCLSLLQEAGAARVIPIVVARTENKKAK